MRRLRDNRPVRYPFRRGPGGSAQIMKNEPETSEPQTSAAALSNPGASADASQHAREEIEERARVAGRSLSRSWLPRLAAVAAGLIAAWLSSRRRAMRRASER
jgi:hypothetical protein